MLYFVAPEWWVPRLHQSAQVLGEAPLTPDTESVTTGGGSYPGGSGAGSGSGSVVGPASGTGGGSYPGGSGAGSGSGSVVGPASGTGGGSYPGGSGAGSGSGSVVGPASGTDTGRGIIIPAENTVDWGGGKESGRDNYYITEDSSPAKFGSSLGWLLQLDGDDLRNAVPQLPLGKSRHPYQIGHGTTGYKLAFKGTCGR